MTVTPPQALPVDVALQQAIAHHRATRLPEAEQLYRAILQVQPNHPDANHNLGVLAVQLKQPAVGLPFFKAALEANAGQGQYWLSYIDALILVNQLDNAKLVLEQGRAHGLQGGAVEVLAARLNQTDTASESAIASSNSPPCPIKSGSKPIQKRAAPDNREINQLLALFNTGQLIEALALARSMTGHFPQHGFGWKILGILLMQTGHDDALAAMQRAALLLPDDVQAQSNLGAAFFDLGRHDEAESACRKALELNPDSIEAHYNLGNTLQQLGRLSDAETAYRHVLSRKPDNAAAHYNLGNVQRRLGSPEKALLSYTAALTISPNYVDAHINMGITLHQLGRFEDALPCYQQLLAINPASAEAFYNTGIALYELRRGSEAEFNYLEALRLKPDYAEAHYNLGIFYQELGNLVKAECCFRLALQHQPKYADAYYSLGQALLSLDHIEHAALVFQQTIDCDPRNVGLDAAVDLAVLHYLQDNFTLCRSMLSTSAPIMSAVGYRHDNSRIYWNYLDKLLEFHLASGQRNEQQQPLGVLYVVGESHALTAHGVVVNYSGTDMRCSSEWIVGCKQWHLANAKPNKYKFKFDAIMARLPRNSQILLFIGEIDCRPGEGIIKAQQKHPEQSLSDVIYATVEGFINYVAEVVNRHQHRIIIGGIPATNACLDTLSAADTEKFTSLIHDFNATLKHHARCKNFEYLDVYSLTDRGDGIASGKWHIDFNHLLPSAVVEAFERHLTGV